MTMLEQMRIEDREPLTNPARRDIAETWLEGWRRRGINAELQDAGRGRFVVVEVEADE